MAQGPESVPFLMAGTTAGCQQLSVALSHLQVLSVPAQKCSSDAKRQGKCAFLMCMSTNFQCVASLSVCHAHINTCINVIYAVALTYISEAALHQVFCVLQLLKALRLPQPLAHLCYYSTIGCNLK